jgi:hypothetical protein
VASGVEVLLSVDERTMVAARREAGRAAVRPRAAVVVHFMAVVEAIVEDWGLMCGRSG